jgi:hypothetical protein
MVTSESEWVAHTTGVSATVSSMAEGRALESDIPSGVIRVPLGRAHGPRYRSVIVRPFGRGADNSAFTLRVWARRRTAIVAGSPGDTYSSARAATAADGSLMKLGTVVCTLSAGVGKANGTLTASDRVADTLVWTPETYWTNLETAFGQTLVAHSPGSDKPGELIIPDVAGVEELIFEPTMTSATLANLLVERQT